MTIPGNAELAVSSLARTLTISSDHYAYP